MRLLRIRWILVVLPCLVLAVEYAFIRHRLHRGIERHEYESEHRPADAIQHRARQADEPKVSAQTNARVADTPKATHTGEWLQTTQASDNGSGAAAIFSVRADVPVVGWLKERIPVLLVRCSGATTEIVIRLGMPASIDNAFGSIVRIGLDDDTPKPYVARISNTGDELIFERPRKLIEAMTKSGKMSVTFSPFNARPAETTFDLTGFTQGIESVGTSCQC